jgi:parallel beta-helix repeat protein
MKWTLTLSMILATGIITVCNWLAGPGIVPVGPATPVEPIAAPTDVPSAAPPCLASGDQNTINAKLQGPGSAAILCPGAVFELTAPVVFSAERQEISTQGLPADDTRATLRIVSPDLTTAVMMRDYDAAVLGNLIVDGNRTNLGPKEGEALIYAGGYSDGQIIRGNRIMDTRSWSALQLIEGGSDSQPCQNALVEDNQIGPAGTSDSMLWADGISLACKDSIVRNNVITDATDGGIVIFGAPGSLIEGNTVRAETRTLLGGIHMVSDGLYDGSYAGTVVRDNIIDASGAVIRIGFAMGARVWLCLPVNEGGHTITGGTVTGNTLRGDHMQYGFIVDDVREWTVTGNIDESTHTGTPSVDCAGVIASPPAGFQYNPARSGGTFQPEFRAAQLDLALWAIVSPRPGE